MRTKVFRLITMFAVIVLSHVNYGYAETVESRVVNGVKYQIDYYLYSYSAWIVGYTSDCPADLTIPSTITYKGEDIDVHIADYAFYGCSILRSVTMPYMDLYSGDSAFEGCMNLVSVDWKSARPTLLYSSGEEEPREIYEIYADRVFANCTSLQHINLPMALENIGEGMFEGCTALANISLPTSLKEIYNYAFQDCSVLTDIKFPSSLTRIGMKAFQGCVSIKELRLPTSLNVISSCAFQNCSSLKTIYADWLDPHHISYAGDEDYGLEFAGIHPNSIMYVPQGARYSYSQMGCWNGICTIREEGAKLIGSLEELSNDKVYRLQAQMARRGILYPVRGDGDNILASRGGHDEYASTCEDNFKIDNTDENQQFSIYKKDGKFYLYSVGQKKFVNGYGHRVVDGSGWFEWSDPNVIQFFLNKWPGYDITITPSSADNCFIFAVDNKEWINLSVDGRYGIGCLGCVGGWTLEDGGNRLEIVEVGTLSKNVQDMIEKSFDNMIFQIGDLSQLSNEKCYLLKGIWHGDKTGIVYARDNGDLDILNGSSNYPTSTTTVDKNNPNYQFALYKKGEDYYLYNIGQGKFVAWDGYFNSTPNTIYISPGNLGEPGQFYLGGVNVKDNP